MSHEPRTIRLQDFAPGDWFTDRSNSKFWLRMYQLLFVPEADFLSALDGALHTLTLDRPVALHYGVMGSIKLPVLRHELHCRADGRLTVLVNADEQELRKAPYVVACTPYVTDGHTESEAAVKGRIDLAAAIIRAHMGLNFMRDVVFDGSVEAGKGQFSVPSSAIKLPQPTEGPFLGKLNWQQTGEIATRLGELENDARERIDLALRFFNEALTARDAFFSYWTSLEILCNGGAQTIRERIGSCYGASRQDVEARTGFKAIARWRHDYFHKGQVPRLSADVERYIQLLFLDLLRHQLGLPLVGHLASVQNAAGYDLRPIGLADRRTAEQKGGYVDPALEALARISRPPN